MFGSKKNFKKVSRKPYKKISIGFRKQSNFQWIFWKFQKFEKSTINFWKIFKEKIWKNDLNLSRILMNFQKILRKYSESLKKFKTFFNNFNTIQAPQINGKWSFIEFLVPSTSIYEWLCLGQVPPQAQKSVPTIRWVQWGLFKDTREIFYLRILDNPQDFHLTISAEM